MESSRPTEKRKTKEHITPGNGNRHEKDEQELDGIRKGGPGQSGLENAGRRPMLHWEYAAMSDEVSLALASIYNIVCFNIAMKNSCKRPGCRFAVTTGMQCDNCKGWFHEACTDLTATAYNRLSKSDEKWVFGTSCQLTWTTIVKKTVDKQERETDTKIGMSTGIPSMEHPSTLMMTCRGSAPSLRRRY
ncbi:unnamed protein product [Schistosoma margrebowiei]|uniref:Uncharacterized protein n=1 Tax=Schistosoma margrebowiei TaxID=48269 RepID=A0A183N157_9TREM|nr:unnamed protein product [Schistosoma margrebowiei]